MFSGFATLNKSGINAIAPIKNPKKLLSSNYWDSYIKCKLQTIETEYGFINYYFLCALTI